MMKVMPQAGILTLNTGSSSIKFALYPYAPEGNVLPQRADFCGHIDRLGTQPQLHIENAAGHCLVQQDLPVDCTPRDACQKLLQQLEALVSSRRLLAVGHRVVHGGAFFSKPVCVDDKVLETLSTLIPLAPLHQQHNLHGINWWRQQRPDSLHIACFDTAFHHTQPALARQFALPKTQATAGICRYGFHGLSYEYISRILPRYAAKPNGKTIVAHLGNGASMCALSQGISQATSMGFSTLDGLMMGTRCGSLDPGVILYLMNTQGMDAAALENLLYRQSGLLGVSGISQDMQTLLNHGSPAAEEAIALFCYRCTREIGALAASIGGLETLVFTGGIGENAPSIRERICTSLQWMGIYLDPVANRQQQLHISQEKSAVEILRLPTDEAAMIAQHVTDFLRAEK